MFYSVNRFYSVFKDYLFNLFLTVIVHQVPAACYTNFPAVNFSRNYNNIIVSLIIGNMCRAVLKNLVVKISALYLAVSRCIGICHKNKR